MRRCHFPTCKKPHGNKKTPEHPTASRPHGGQERGRLGGVWLLVFLPYSACSRGLGTLPSGRPAAFPRKGGDRRTPCWLGRTCPQLSAGCQGCEHAAGGQEGRWWVRVMEGYDGPSKAPGRGPGREAPHHQLLPRPWRGPRNRHTGPQAPAKGQLLRAVSRPDETRVWTLPVPWGLPECLSGSKHG